MRDQRDPIKVYEQLMYQKTAWNCSILEAADRVERDRLHRASETSGNPTQTGNGSPGEFDRQNGSRP